MHSLLPCCHRVTGEEAKAGGRLKPFGSSGNESTKDGLWSWCKWTEIPWQRKGAESASLPDLRGTAKAQRRTPRYLGMCWEGTVARNYYQRGKSMPPWPQLLRWQPDGIHLCVPPRSSSAVQVSTGFPVRRVPKAPACPKRSLRALAGKGAALSPRLTSLSAKHVFHCKVKHLLPTHGKTEKPTSEDKIWRENNCFSCSCQWGAAFNQGDWEPVRGTPALRPSLGNIPGKPCLPQNGQISFFLISHPRKWPLHAPNPLKLKQFCG